MKRSPMPPRRTPLARSAALQQGGAIQRAKRLSPRSKKREEEQAERLVVRELVFARDGHRCQLAGVQGAGRCFGPLTPHHRQKASQGGAYTVANLTTLCSHHNDAIEADADLAAVARSKGLVIRRGDHPEEGQHHATDT